MASQSISDVRICFEHLSTASSSENVQRIMASAKTRTGSWIVTLNLEMIGRSLADAKYASLLSQADWFVADGAPVKWMMKHLSHKNGPTVRTTGIDLVHGLLVANESRGIALIGGSAPRRMIDLLAVRLERIAHIDDGIIDTSHPALSRLADTLRHAQAQIVLVALGVPKQDVVCRFLRCSLPQVTCIGVGGAFDVLAGLQPRAPLWMQDNGLEWLFRLACEPRRLWFRYMMQYPVTCLRILGIIMRHGSKAFDASANYGNVQPSDLRR